MERRNTVESPQLVLRYAVSLLGGFPFDPATTALLRAALNEVCEGVSRFGTGARTQVASRILEAAKGDATSESLKRVACDALHDAPTMWR